MIDAITTRGLPVGGRPRVILRVVVAGAGNPPAALRESGLVFLLLCERTDSYGGEKQGEAREAGGVASAVVGDDIILLFFSLEDYRVVDNSVRYAVINEQLSYLS